METTDGVLAVNGKTPEETRKLYEKILEASGLDRSRKETGYEKGKWRKKILAGFLGILMLAGVSGCQEALSEEFEERSGHCGSERNGRKNQCRGTGRGMGGYF